MADSKKRIFWGTFFSTTDNFLLAPPDNSPFVDVNFDGQGSLELSVVSKQLDRHQQVSILGHMGERVITGSKKIPSILPEKAGIA